MAYLTLTTSVSQSYVQKSSGQVAVVSLNVALVDARPFVAYKPVGLMIDWGDGSQVVSVSRTPSPFSQSYSHTYAIGNYVLKVIGFNYQQPVSERAVSSSDIRVVSAAPTVPTLAEQGLQPIVYGPILPRDQGFPNAKEWAFQTAQDSVVLESSARMLLITAVGERLMQLDYGTRLPAMLFSPSSPSLQDDVRQEVVRAFSVHEPRLTVTAVSVTGIGDRQVMISVGLMSQLDQRQFEVSTTFAKS